jgi:putative PIN family toxin of toxin-antitoxin system
MIGEYIPRVVLDTNVIFEGLTQKNSACGLIIDAWFAGLLNVCVSDALVYEYIDVLVRKFSPAKYQQAQTALATLLHQSTFTTIFYTWRPASPDPGDDLVIDCAMNANAMVVT